MMAGDVVVFDCDYCSFMMIAQLLNQPVDVCARLHHLRRVDFRKGHRFGKYDHLIVWTKPDPPAWMDKETYANIPATLELRELRYAIVEKGKRTKSITVVTTLTDVDAYSNEDIAELYGYRWSSVLDIRSIKDSLNLGHVRCKSPEMVRIRLWYTTLLEEVAQQRNEPRRDRVNPRVIKSRVSNWPKKRLKHRDFLQPAMLFLKSIVMLN